AGVPHLRVENRCLGAGPTVADMMANAAFYFGLVRHLAESERPLWSQMSFSAAEENFHAAAENGIDTQVYWPGVGQVRVTELVLRKLLPLAHEGLDAWGVPAGDRDRLLAVIEQRCISGRNGASWQVDTVRRLEETTMVNRAQALREMTRRYAVHMHSNEPVHTWPAV
ncbi:MAG TPA: glutamate--cysteine ligase, partial [Actinophytocola sp.]|nr:glutamate--cysteine ligase [Actinophytocola sp.]